MKKKYITGYMLLFLCSGMFFTANAQDTVFHAVNDPELMQYYTSHWFWIAVFLAGFIALVYLGRRRKRKGLQDTIDDKIK